MGFQDIWGFILWKLLTAAPSWDILPLGPPFFFCPRRLGFGWVGVRDRGRVRIWIRIGWS